MNPSALVSKFKPGSAFHTDTQRKIRDRIDLSRKYMTKYSDKWALAEDQFQAYIHVTEADKLRKTAKDKGMPQYTTVNIPYSYATLLTAHTYYTSVFLSRNPIFQFASRDGVRQNSEQCVEAVMDYQLHAGQWLVPLYIWLLDPGKYGFGVLGHHWDKEMVKVREKTIVQPNVLGFPMGRPREEWVVKELPAYQGNKLYNVRPQDFLFDPRVSLWKFQTGEFCGRYVEIPVYELLAGANMGNYFNVDLVRAALKGDYHSGFSERDSGGLTQDLPNQVPYATNVAPSVVPAYEVFIRLIPRDWGLDESPDPEIWVFTVMAKETIIFGARPLGAYNGKYPFNVLEQEPNGYNIISRSMLEVMQPMQETLNWLINTHFYNVRASLNNMFLYDPAKVSSKDMENPSPGKLIRLKPGAFGVDVRTVMAQFPVADVTRTHLADSEMVMGMLQRMTGVTDNVMGLVNSGGRKTATEVRTSSSLGINRLKTTCEYFSAMGFEPLAQQLLQCTQQYLDERMYYRIVGDLAQFEQQNTLQVGPEDIAGFYDFVPVDGTMPVDRYAQANLWQALMGQAAKIPQVAMAYDWSKIFGWVGQLAGLKNINSMRVQMMPNGALQQQIQAGNMIPAGQAAPAPADGGTPPMQNQIQGMGPAG